MLEFLELKRQALSTLWEFITVIKCFKTDRTRLNTEEHLHFLTVLTMGALFKSLF